jgi:hypothetical protein
MQLTKQRWVAPPSSGAEPFLGDFPRVLVVRTGRRGRLALLREVPCLCPHEITYQQPSQSDTFFAHSQSRKIGIH